MEGLALTKEKACTHVKPVIDYMIASPALFKIIVDFSVKEMNNLLSDVHNPIECTLIRSHANINDFDGRHQMALDTDTYMRNGPVRPSWNNEKKELFENGTSSKTDLVQEINSEIICHLQYTSNLITCSELNTLVDRINKILKDCALVAGSISKKPNKTRLVNKSKIKRKSDNKPWFTSECEIKRKTLFTAKKMYVKDRSTPNKENIKIASINYRRSINEAFRNYYRELNENIRRLRRGRPKEFWNIINCADKPKQNEVNIDKDVLYNHFQKLSEAKPTSETESDYNIVLDDKGVRIEADYSDENDISSLNQQITNEEVTYAISKLKLNKSCGIDEISNEYLKSSTPYMTSLYTNLFNLILHTGVIPEIWTESIIKPIYKQKGDRNNPDNYRGSSLKSYFSKLFTAVLNNRLEKFIEVNQIIGEEQAGFRHGYSTLDNIYILKTITDFYLSKKKRLFVAFVDFRKAYDNLNRSALWYKMIKNGIKGNFLRVIFNMYDNASSSVNSNGFLSERFMSSIGVKQGDNISSVLFTIFLYDIKHYITAQCQGLQTLNKHIAETQHNNTYEVIENILLYADDTLLMAESPEDLQMALNNLKGYCDLWQMEVNTQKTKLVIFSRVKIQKVPKLYYGTSRLKLLTATCI